MSSRSKLLLGLVGWLALVTLLHLWLNTHVLDYEFGRRPSDELRFRVGFLPVT